MKVLIITALSILLNIQNTFSKEHNILDFGAVSDTSKYSTVAIQKAIDACASSGGGQVTIPAGNYKSSSIFFKSNVSLYLEAGAVLFASPNIKDYKRVKTQTISLRTQDSIVQFILGDNCTNVSICGFGEINGQGKSMPYSPDMEGITRPHLIRFINCKDVKVENISLKAAGCWMQHYLECERVQIRGLRIVNRTVENNDMLDIDGCRDVTISDCISDTEDDGITLKATSGKICENIAVTNCVVKSRWQAIKLGTESSGGFKNVSITNCIVTCTNVYPWNDGTTSDPLGAIALIISDGAVMENIVISNISIDNSEAPIYIRLINRARPYDRNKPITNVGKIKDISINNIRITNARGNGNSITGQPGFPVENIRLSNIVIESNGVGTQTDFLRVVPEDPKAYPSPVKWGLLPAYGFYVRHAKNVTFDGIELRTQIADYRPAFVFDDVVGVNLKNMQIAGDKNNEASIYLKQTKDVIAQGNSIIGSTSCFVKTAGDSTFNVLIVNNILKNATAIFTEGAECKGRVVESGNVK